jgi:hypothetical protein
MLQPSLAPRREASERVRGGEDIAFDETGDFQSPGSHRLMNLHPMISKTSISFTRKRHAFAKTVLLPVLLSFL